MNTQFKKGVLELVVLKAIEKKDKYGYELVSEIGEVMSINEGTMYPVLKRLTIENMLSTYLIESSEGPTRKYYHLTESGKVYLSELTAEWLEFANNVNQYLNKEEQ